MALDLDLGITRRIDDGSPLGLLTHRTIAAIALLAHLTCLWLISEVGGGGLALAQTIAAFAATFTVYAINAMQTCWLRGPWRWYLGLLPFLASCWLGIAGCVLLALGLAGQGIDGLAAGFAGAVFGLWWNHGAVSRHGWAGR